MTGRAARAEQPVVLGVVGRPWGVKGQFLLDPRGTDPEFLLARGSLRLRRRNGEESERTLRGSHIAGGKLVVHIEGCSTMDEAEAWRGAEVVLPPEEFGPAPDGSYYLHELAGCEVRTVDGGTIGRVTEVQRTAGGELLVVRSGARERLIPFAREICRTIDPSSRTIVIDPPDGLLDLDEDRGGPGR